MKNAVMYGAGNIGRGFIGELFSESDYRVTFIDVDDGLVSLLESRGQYPIRILDDDNTCDKVISNVGAVNGKEIPIAAKAVAAADIMATAVGGNILARIAPVIARGIELRSAGGKPLDIIVCENLHNADKIFRGLVEDCICPCCRAFLNNRVGFVSASIGRMVPVVTRELKAVDPLMVGVEPFCVLPVDARAFKGEIPKIKNLLPADNIAYHTDSKLYIHNMLHSACAYLGYIKGYTYIYEAVHDNEIVRTVRGALDEISRSIAREHGVGTGLPIEYGEDLIRRFANRALADSVERVGRDTPRKLAFDDRLVGAARLCEKHGVKYDNIACGIAAALVFSADDLSKAVAQLARSSGPGAALIKYAGLGDNSGILRLSSELYSEIKMEG